MDTRSKGLIDMFRNGYPGWDGLIDRIEDVLEKNSWTVFQIKEKFGGIRCYADPPPDSIKHPVDNTVQEVIWKIESESFKICCECGEPGVPRCPEGGCWTLTHCDKCFENRKNSQNLSTE